MPFYVYCLRSDSSPACSATYIGFTVNPRRRLRQHNGDLTSGAVRTHKYRPWDHVCVVSGFPSKIVALMFEWQWQHPKGSRILKEQRRLASESAASGPSATPTDANTGIKYGGKGVKGQLHILASLLRAPLWSQLHLTTNFLNEEHMQFYQSCFPVSALPAGAALPVSVPKPSPALPTVASIDSEGDLLEGDLLDSMMSQPGGTIEAQTGVRVRASVTATGTTPGGVLLVTAADIDTWTDTVPSASQDAATAAVTDWDIMISRRSPSLDAATAAVTAAAAISFQLDPAVLGFAHNNNNSSSSSSNNSRSRSRSRSSSSSSGSERCISCYMCKEAILRPDAPTASAAAAGDREDHGTGGNGNITAADTETQVEIEAGAGTEGEGGGGSAGAELALDTTTTATVARLWCCPHCSAVAHVMCTVNLALGFYVGAGATVPADAGGDSSSSSSSELEEAFPRLFKCGGCDKSVSRVMLAQQAFTAQRLYMSADAGAAMLAKTARGKGKKRKKIASDSDSVSATPSAIVPSAASASAAVAAGDEIDRISREILCDDGSSSDSVGGGCGAEDDSVVGGGVVMLLGDSDCDSDGEGLLFGTQSQMHSQSQMQQSQMQSQMLPSQSQAREIIELSLSAETPSPKKGKERSQTLELQQLYTHAHTHAPSPSSPQSSTQSRSPSPPVLHWEGDGCDGDGSQI